MQFKSLLPSSVGFRGLRIMPGAVDSALTRVGLSRVGLVANSELKLGYPRPKGSDSHQSGHECLETFAR